MAHLEHLYYFVAMTIFICCFFASELHGYSRTLFVLLRAIPLLSLFCLLFFCIGASRIFTDVVRVSPCHSVAMIFCLLFLHRSITDIHGRCPCYSVPFRCYHHFVCCFCIGASRIFTDVVRVSPCHSVAIIILFVVFLHWSITDIHGHCPCHSVATMTFSLNVCKKYSLYLLQPISLCIFATNCGVL